MVQTEGDQQTFQQDEYPYTQRAFGHDEILEQLHAVLDIRPDDHGQQRHRKHHEEADHKDKR